MTEATRPLNWATNIQFQAATYHTPQSIEAVQEIVRQAATVKVIGSGHCFNEIADTTGSMISLHNLDQSITLDHARQTATVPAGMTHIDLALALHQEGYALRNMASLPHITVIGAAVSATHGSGDGNGNLATHISGLEMIKANGEMAHFSREQDGEKFNGMVVALGALGVVTRVMLDVVPAYFMQQQIYCGLTLTKMADHFDEIMANGYSVSLFTLWQDEIINQVWVKQLCPEGEPMPIVPTLFGAPLATEKMFPVDGYPAERCTDQSGTPGPWYDRLPHFHLNSSMVGGNELQSEYFVTREDAVDALLAVERLNQEMAHVMTNSEVRTMAGDDLWLSMAYQQDCIAIHFSWQNNVPDVEKVLPVLEEALAPYQARPHWGKLFAMSREQIQPMYAKFPEFQAQLNEFDPERKFGNPFLETYVY